MKLLKSDKYIWQIMLAAFLLSGFLHVVLYGIPYADGIVQIFDGTVMLCWMTAILRRIVDKRVRRCMVVLAVLMAVYFVLQMSKYKYMTDAAALRYTWYCFYIPMCLIPLMLFFLAVFMNRPEDKADSRKWLLLLIPAILLVAGVLTNDLHCFAFRFPEGITDATGYTGTYTYGPLYFLVIAWEVLLVLLALIIILRKCGTSAAKKHFWLPAGILLAGGFLMLLGVFGLAPKIHGVTVWQLTEVYIFTCVLFLEGCIRIGMIPANTGYERLFGLLRTPAAIYDPEGKEAVTSAGIIPKQADEDVKIETMDIYGGRVIWTVDLKEINSLNRQIMEVTGQIESRNERLLSENQMKEEQAGLDARNRLYDRIAEIVRPQLSLIETLLENHTDKDFDAAVARVNVLNAYIKRRSNMELLKADTGRLPVGELNMAIRESMEYLKDTGITVSVNAFSRDEFPSELIIFAYELFERVVESCLETAKMAAVFLTCKEHVLRIRLMIETREEDQSAGEFSFMPETYRNTKAGFCGSLEEERQENERIVTITLQEGGSL